MKYSWGEASRATLWMGETSYRDVQLKMELESKQNFMRPPNIPFHYAVRAMR